MPISRNAVDYLERSGLIEPVRPKPRFDPSQLRVHTIPLSNMELSTEALHDIDGPNPPDRAGPTQGWPPPHA